MVYKAHQEDLNRTVALKMILSGEFSSEVELQRFHAEAEAAANLDHPGIVRVFDVGEYKGRAYFSMAYVDGVSLSDIGRELRWEGRKAAGLIALIAKAVSYAHEQGVLHRDLKPSNILIDALGQPKITDFGLAKRMNTDSSITTTGQIIGTPSFMSPEQAAARSEDLGPATDVYGVGAILYFLLTGLPPFRAESAIKTLEHVLVRDPLPPRKVDADIPIDLDTICLKCLEKDPEERYPNAQALVDELDRFLKNRPIEARPVGSLVRTWSWCKRNPLTSSMLTAITALLFTLAVSSTITSIKLRSLNEAERELRIGAETSEKEVKKAWQAANQAAHESQRRTLRLQVATGSNYLNKFDYWTALHWFVRAWRDDPDAALNESAHRHRIGGVLAVLPQVIGVGAHDRPLQFARLTPDNQSALTLTDDGCAYLWRPFAGERYAALTHNAGVITYALISPDGGRVATTGEDGHLKIWQTQSGEPFGEPIVHERALIHAAWHPSGDYLAVVDSEGQLLFCDLTRDPPTATVMGQAGVVERVQFLPDPDQFLVTRPDDTVDVFNCSMAAASLSSRFSIPHRKAMNLSDRVVDGDLDLPRVSANGRWLVTHVDKKMAVWDIWAEEPVREVSMSRAIMDLAVNRDGTQLFSTARDVNSQAWTLSDSSIEKAHRMTFPRQAWSLALHPAGTHLVTESSVGVLHLHNAQGSLLAGSFGHAGFVSGLSYSQDGRFLVSAGMDGTLRLWDCRPTELRTEHYRFEDGRGETVRPSASLSKPDYGTWLGASGDGALEAWLDQAGSVVSVRNRLDPEEVIVSCTVQGDLVGARFSGDGTQCFIIQDHKRVHGLSTDPATPSTFDIEGRGVWQVSDDGRTLLANWSGSFYVWDTQTSEIIMGPVGPSIGPPLAKEFNIRNPLADGAYGNRAIKHPQLSPDGHYFVFGHTDKEGLDRQVEIYDLRTGAHTHIPAAFGDLAAININDQGSRVVVGSSDTTAKVFSLVTGAAVGPWIRASSFVRNAALSPDGKMVCTLDSGALLQVWDVETADLLSVTYKLSGIDKHAPIWFGPEGKSISMENSDGSRGTLRLAKHLGSKDHLEKFIQLVSSREMDETGSVNWMDQTALLGDFESYLAAWKASTTNLSASASRSVLR